MNVNYGNYVKYWRNLEVMKILRFFCIDYVKFIRNLAYRFSVRYCAIPFWEIEKFKKWRNEIRNWNNFTFILAYWVVCANFYV